MTYKNIEINHKELSNLLIPSLITFPIGLVSIRTICPSVHTCPSVQPSRHPGVPTFELTPAITPPLKFVHTALPRVDFRPHIAVEVHHFPRFHVSDVGVLVIPLLEIYAVARHHDHTTEAVPGEAESSRRVKMKQPMLMIVFYRPGGNS